MPPRVVLPTGRDTLVIVLPYAFVNSSTNDQSSVGIFSARARRGGTVMAQGGAPECRAAG
jgi:hypothetical protein